MFSEAIVNDVALQKKKKIPTSTSICLLLKHVYLFFFFLFPWEVLQGFSGGSDGKESACNARDRGLFPGLGGSPGEGNGYPLQYSCLENSMDREGFINVSSNTSIF